MVTADRPAYAKRAIAAFAAQTWPARELVVLDALPLLSSGKIDRMRLSR